MGDDGEVKPDIQQQPKKSLFFFSPCRDLLLTGFADGAGAALLLSRRFFPQ